MRPLRVHVRNVRSARDVELHVRPFSALIGPNNVGKSTLLDAVRLFYNALKWDNARDQPWETAGSDVSWVQIDYELSPEEADALKITWLDTGALSVRRYLTEDGEHRKGAYYLVPGDDQALEPTGWRDVSRQLGQCVYVPAVTRVQDQTSLTDSSPLLEVLLLAFTELEADPILDTVSKALQTLRDKMERPGGSVAELEDTLADALSPWNLAARVSIGELTDEFILQHLINFSILHDGNYRPVDTQGSGVQRALIAGLIQAAAQLRKRAGHTPFRWILFEEPEAFLHPAQVTRLAQDLKRLTGSGNAAVTVTTHDPTMLSASETPPQDIARVFRYGSRMRVISPDPDHVSEVLARVRLRSTYTQAAKNCFKANAVRLGSTSEEHMRVLHDLDSRRASAFFADRVIVVEGISDTVFFDWLDRRGFLDRIGSNVGFLDAGGKYELHRASSTLSLFGIPHVIVWDEDAAMHHPGTDAHVRHACRDRAAFEAVCAAAHDADSALAGGVRLAGSIEHWLGFHEEKTGAWKSANLAGSLAVACADPASPVLQKIRSLLTVITDIFEGRRAGRYQTPPELVGCRIEHPFPATTLDFAAEFASLPHVTCRCLP